MRTGTVWILTVLLGLTAAAQQPRPTFEAVSLRLPEDGRPRAVFRNGPELYARPGINLYQLVGWAYDVSTLHIVGGSNWATTTFWEMVAKAAPGTNDEQVREMVQQMLESRFDLKMHTEERMAPAFELAPIRQDGRLGPKLSRSALDCEPVLVQQQKNLEPGLAEKCRVLGGLTSSSRTQVTIRGAALSRLGAHLAGAAGGLVTVHPQLQEGRFDVSLVYQHDAFRSLLSDNSDVPSLTVALEDQLGLRLNRIQQRTKFIVIDSAEKPSEN